MTLPGIGSWLERRVLLSPEKEAVVDGSRRLSYRQLNQRTDRLAGALTDLGLNYGDRIAMLSLNRLEFIEVIMAAAKLGLILVPLNWRLTAPELAFILEDSRTQTLVFDSELTELAGEVRESVPLLRVVAIGAGAHAGLYDYEALLADRGDKKLSPEKAPDLDTPHIIMYTAGTTGRPKGAILTQGASFWNAVNLYTAIDFTSRDRNLVVLPMFHIGGIGLFMLPMLYVGGTAVVQRTFDPEKTFRLLEEEAISLFFGVPAIFLALIQHPGFRSESFQNLRLVMSGGAPLPVSLVQQYHDAGIALQQGFGMSEAAPSIATLKKELALSKAGSIGRAVFHLDARIVDDNMRELPSGQVGELVIRGPNLMQGYWNRPEATEEAFAGGWFHTGDLARMDPDGDMTIVERKKDMFISGGENVYPAEVENAIYELPQVAENAVVGIADERWGEVGRAFVVLKPDQLLDEKEIGDHLKKRLAKYKIPKQITFIDQLPRNAAGKVLKTVLRKQ
ncbi:MAG: long-chain fatty acid--CoA ligase [Deltaproteobacteria bacterium]|nr:long-chain fatty acid--CoA ligase [Deltaproteobacteria bacterium]